MHYFKKNYDHNIFNRTIFFTFELTTLNAPDTCLMRRTLILIIIYNILYYA